MTSLLAQRTYIVIVLSFPIGACAPAATVDVAGGTDDAQATLPSDKDAGTSGPESLEASIDGDTVSEPTSPDASTSPTDDAADGQDAWLSPTGAAAVDDSAADATNPSDVATPAFSLRTSPLELHPSFLPSVHDYYVRCAQGLNDLTIEMSGAARTTIHVALAEDQLAIVENAHDDASESYFVRCLPHDFPTLVATSHPEASAPTPGWYLVGTASVAAGEASFAMVIDANGTPVWYHRSPAGGAIDVDLPSRGTISYAPFFSYGNDGVFEVYRLSPWHREIVRTVGILLDPHELRALPEGGYMMLGAPITSDVDLTGLTGGGPGSTIVNCAIQEIDGSGNVVWQWLATDHIDPARESTVPAGTSLSDPFHCNSIDIDDAGNLLLSLRNTDAVFYIDKASGKIVWKLNGTAYNRDGAQVIRIEGDPQVAFYRQHDARFRRDGRISLFDNHGVGTGAARGVEYAIDRTNSSASVTWEYRGTAASLYMGSFRRYDDRTNLIGWGYLASGRNLVFSEVDNDGRALLDLEFGPGDASYRAIKVPSDALDADMLRATAGMP